MALIAEFCQNHNGDFNLLARMVDAAAANGATHGKMQTIFAETVAFRPQFEQGLTVDGTVRSIQRPYQAEYDRLKGLEITFEESARFIRLCRDAGIVPMTTCFAREHVDALSELGFESIK
ncbi:MAG: N-acetylneuraminate synthase family protein, partial [Pseudomonadota bacterium]|nr:N-acetylneuraminate synthase family protein [Pseudomonadota bacterium]